mmetsp:Transcript_82520/g.218993  ORF Transcript_82520/g.218993 Transcript_82520/m.218993 type:complete len:255 (+) Transcript_82520:392-1156(+)
MAVSTSALEMFSPPRMIRSFARSRMYRAPSGSSLPMSPVRNQPSTEIASAVASGFRQYSLSMVTPRRRTSPGVPGGSSLLPSSTILMSTNGRALPQEAGLLTYSWDEKVLTVSAFDSVRPQPCPADLPFFAVCALSFAGGAAPPPPTPCSVEVSNLSYSGWFSNSIDMVGTPVKFVTFSLWISRRASSASHLYINTTFLPSMNERRKMEWLPVAWKRGTGQSATCCCSCLGAPLLGGLGARAAAALAAMPPTAL